MSECAGILILATSLLAASPAPGAPAASAAEPATMAILAQLPVLSLEEDTTDVAKLVGPVREGDQVVLFFWSTYDRFSREELPAVRRFYAEHRDDRSLHLLTVNVVEMREGLRDVRDFMAKEAPGLPVAIDPSWRSLERLQRRAHLADGTALGLPTLAVLDGRGNVEVFQRGATGRTYEILTRAVSRKGSRGPRGRG